MKKELLLGICALAFIAMLFVALFNRKDVQDGAANALHEITTNDLWKQTAYNPQMNCPTYPQNGQGYIYPYQANVPYQGGNMRQAAMAGAPPIYAGQEKPTLVKQFGCEVIEIIGGKLKITGVMGASWADKAGLKAGDILLTFADKKIESLKDFTARVTTVPPEKDYKVTFMRGSRVKKCLVTVGEGEMEGFTPIAQPK
ncbi:MAG: PDZ domain-containing protein [Candidatus Omnitrophica bacterium]|nr:PDZ domain-containing protein [Candidatus Omnitrophota bacterium]